MKKIEKEFIQHLYHEIEDEETADEKVLDILHLVGFITMYFNGLEKLLDSYICTEFTERTDAPGLIVIHNMGYANKVDMFKRFQDYFQVCIEKSFDGYDDLIRNLRECAKLRNLVVHADWENSNEEGYTYVNLKINKSGLKQEYVQFSEESLKKIIELILHTRVSLSKYWEKREEFLSQ